MCECKRKEGKTKRRRERERICKIFNGYCADSDCFLSATGRHMRKKQDLREKKERNSSAVCKSYMVIEKVHEKILGIFGMV